MFHPNSNKRNRLRERLRCSNLLHQYRHGLPPEAQTNNNGHKPYELKIVRPNGEIVSIKPIPIDSSIRGIRDDIAIYAGDLPIEALIHLYS